MGWAGVKNGALLRLAEEEFDVFVTTDQNLKFQQSLATFRIAFVLLVAVRNDIEVLRPLMASLREQLPELQPGKLTLISA
jgi:hypothetical protein